jgi:hypothetical protein
LTYFSNYLSAVRYSQDTKKIRRKYVPVASYVFPSFGFFVSVSHLAKGTKKYRVATVRILKEWRGRRFSSYLPSTYLRIYKDT